MTTGCQVCAWLCPTLGTPPPPEALRSHGVWRALDRVAKQTSADRALPSNVGCPGSRRAGSPNFGRSRTVEERDQNRQKCRRAEGGSRTTAGDWGRRSSAT